MYSLRQEAKEGLGLGSSVLKYIHSPQGRLFVDATGEGLSQRDVNIATLGYMSYSFHFLCKQYTCWKAIHLLER